VMGFCCITRCALCGAELPCAYEGKAHWDQDPPLAQYTSDRLEMLCGCNGLPAPEPQPAEEGDEGE
jgi:hypothetical protein